MAVVSFDGDDTYFVSSDNIDVIVNKVKSVLSASKKIYNVKTKIKKYTTTLKFDTDSAITKVKGKTYNTTINAKCRVTFKITKLINKRKFNAVIGFIESNNYLKVTKIVKITVKK